MAEHYAFMASFLNPEPVAVMELVPPETDGMPLSFEAPPADPENTASTPQPSAEPDAETDPELARLSTCISDPELSAGVQTAVRPEPAPSSVTAAAVRPAPCGICRRDPNMQETPSSPARSICRARFLTAASIPFPVDILIDGQAAVLNSDFASVSSYLSVPDGFHTVTIRRSNGMRAILYQNRLPFNGNQKFTFAVTDSASGGLNLVRLSDTGCSCQSCRYSCYRVANMSYPGSSFDIRTAGGDSVFSDAAFGQAAPYKQAAAGSYRFFVTDSSGFRPVRELPVILQDFLSGSLMAPKPLLSFQARISAQKTYTTYLIGNTWSSFPFQALTVEDE